MNLKNSKIALFVFSLGAVALIGCNNKPVTSKVTITFDGNGGTVTPANGSSEKVTVDKGTLFKDVKAPKAEKTDYTFDAWTSTKDDITTKIKDDYVFNADITLFAHYTEVSSYTYKFVDGDKTIKEDTIKKGEMIPDPGDLDDKHAKDPDGGDDYYHFTFDGWYDGEDKFEIGTTISKNVTYTSKFTKGNEVVLVPGKQPTCSDPGYEDAYKCEECFASTSVVAYYDVPDSIDDEHLIGDEDEYNAWIKEGGEGYIPATGEHDYEPEFRGDYKKNYTALEEFDNTNLQVWLHCSYETEHTNDVQIDDFEVEYEATDEKLHVNNGGASVTFTYEGVDYEEELPLTIAPISVDEPTAGTNSFTYTGSEITYTVAESDKYAISNNKGTDVGNYNATISLTDKGGDYVWKTTKTTDDLTYPFLITKAANAITGLAESYTTTCHTAPTITGVTSTFGEVQYDYWQKVGEADEVKVDADDLEAADNTTYRVRAYVPGTGNYDLVEDYATLTVNHDCSTETVPTDHIGYKELNCVCGYKEDSSNLMESGDVNFKGSTFGIKVKKVTSEGEEDHGSVALAGDGTRAIFDVNNTNTFKIYLPLTNFSAFETNVTFNMKVISGYFYLGFSSSTKYYTGDNDLIYGVFKKDDNSFKLVANKNGSVAFNESITITDNDILNGTKPLGLYVDCAQVLPERVITFLSTDLDECDHPLIIAPTDHIGYKKCALCDEEDTDTLMESSDVDFSKNKYGVSIKKGGEDYGTVDFNGGGVWATFGAGTTDDLELYLPLTNFEAFNENVTFKMKTVSGYFYIGFSSSSRCEVKDNDYVYGVFDNSDNSFRLVVVHAVNEASVKMFDESITITDNDILNGAKSLALYVNNKNIADRIIKFEGADLDECSHPSLVGTTDCIDHRYCALCGESSDQVMTSGDVDFTVHSYGANVDNISNIQHGQYGMYYYLYPNEASEYKSTLTLPKINLKNYETAVFSNDDGNTENPSKNFTEGGTGFILTNRVDLADHDSVSFIFDRISDSTYTLTLSINGEEKDSVDITDTEVLEGRKGYEVAYILFWHINRQFNLRLATLTPYTPAI